MTLGISLRKAVMVLIFSSFVIVFAILLSLTYFFMSYMPSQPNLELGLVCPFTIHGYVVYISRVQCLMMDSLFWICFILCPIALFLKQKYTTLKKG